MIAVVGWLGWPSMCLPSCSITPSSTGQGYKTLFSISPFKWTVFLYSLLCNWEGGNFPQSFSFCVFLFLISLYALIFSPVWPYLDPLNLLRPILRQSPPRTKTEISFQVCKHQCLLSEASPHLSAQFSCNHKMWQAWNHPPKHYRISHMREYASVPGYVCAHFISVANCQIWSWSFCCWLLIQFHCFLLLWESTVSQTKVLEVTNLLSKAFLYTRGILSFLFHSPVVSFSVSLFF